DLCGKNIRHHKFPDESVDPLVNTFSEFGNKIRILGVRFENIAHPLDENGSPIESIVGYEILRGSREGNKTIISKGIINNLREYRVPENPNLTGLYQNYPYNDLAPDVYLTAKEQTGENGGNSDGPNGSPLEGYRKDMFSFHGPEVSFSNPFLNGSEIKLYQELYGKATGRFEVPYLHPKFKLITNDLDTALDIFATAVAVIQAAGAVAGGLAIEIGHDSTGLPNVPLGVPYVTSEGPYGSFATAFTAIAIGANIVFQAAYTILFGIKVYKEQSLHMALALMPLRQFASQYNSHGFYDQSVQVEEGNRRREILDAGYVDSTIQSFGAEFQVNNINRSRFVALKIDGEYDNPTSVTDKSRFTMSQVGKSYNQPVSSDISCFYGAIKLSVPSQYGQLESIKQLPISECIYKTFPAVNNVVSSPVFFGGDVYINRFTEKNSMFFFNAWMQDEPDNSEFDYTLY
ncbi:MAG: hypothetical protein ACK5XN_02680, partial [Bacteroidota bacterium]